MKRFRAIWGRPQSRDTIGRKPDYGFERKVRDRLKAEKKAKRTIDKAEAREKKSGPSYPSAQAGRTIFNLNYRHKGNTMYNENAFLIRYGLTPFVSHAEDAGRSVFTIRSSESGKMIRHATSLIVGNYGETAAIHVA